MSVTCERPIRKFNPGLLQSDAEVIQQFVVRNRELKTILEILRENLQSPSCQHVLVIGPRGRGKSMLLARVSASLHTDDVLANCFLPIRFMAENHEISHLADFWLEALFHLEQECAASDSGLARNLERTRIDLARRWRESALEDLACAAVLEAANRLDKKLVLMVENFQTLCGSGDEDFGWKLRRVLQSEPQIVLVASATTRFSSLDDAREPFFELFRVIDLEPLDCADCGRLWRAESRHSATDREIRPLQILTGGNPRLLVMFAGFTRRRAGCQLMEELVTVIDECSEHFRGHLESLANQERRVYLAVLDLWHPVGVAEIAARARMDIRIVSTLLRRLVNRGSVIAEGGVRKRKYSAAERLSSICYKLLRECNEVGVVHSLIRFMTVFYTEIELTGLCEKFLAESKNEKIVEFSANLWAKMDRLARTMDDNLSRSDALAILLDSDKFERTIKSMDIDKKPEANWRVRWARVLPLFAQGKRQEALDRLSAAYEIFDPNDETMLRELLWLVPNLISYGLSERELLGILEVETEKSDALAPLIVALRRRAGEAVHVAVEVLEVAKDIGSRIDGSRSGRASSCESR